jgi:glycosyltransferase involved in cell wall biosynthesis
MPHAEDGSLHVIQAVPTLAPAGAERVAADLAVAAADAGMPVTVFALRDGTLGRQLESRGVSLDIGRDGESTLAAVGRLTRLIERGAPVVLHSHLIRANLIARAAARRARPQAVIETQHDTYVRPRWASWYRRSTQGRVDVTIAVSDRIAVYAHQVMRVPESRLRVIPNGVDIQRYAAGESPWHDPPTIGSIGSLLEVKRFDALVRAFADVRTRGHDARLEIVGDGPAGSALGSLVEELQLAHRVSMPGTAEDVPAALRDIDIFVQPRVRSSLGMATMEAMAASKPVIMGVDEGFSEALPRDAVTVVPSADVSALAGALANLLDRPDRARGRGRAGSDWLRRERSAERSTAEYLDLYRSLV